MGRRIYVRPEISRVDDDGQHPRMNSDEGKQLQRKNAWEKDKARRRKAVAYRKQLEARVAHLEAENKDLRSQIEEWQNGKRQRE